MKTAGSAVAAFKSEAGGNVARWKLVMRVLNADPEAGEAWDERTRRINEGTATEEDVRMQEIAQAAASAGRAIPREARRMPSRPPLPLSGDVDRAISIGIPRLFAEEIVSGQVRRTPATDATAMVQGRTRILLMTGERGAGKSFAAAIWLWRFRAPSIKDATARMFLPFDKLDDMTRDEREVASRATSLVLDDVGAEQYPDAVATMIIRRHRDAMPTIVTTNLKDEEHFADRYGARVMDRLREVGKFVKCGARSLRRPR